MKVLILILGLGLNVLFSCKAQGGGIKVLDVKDTQVFTLLDEVIRHEKTDTIKGGIYVIKITEGDTSQELRVGNFSVNIFSKYVLGKKDKLLGFFKYRGYFIFVYGKSTLALFQKTRKECSFDFFTERSKKLKREEAVSEPPDVIEPTVWLYDYRNNVITFKDVGYFNLLK
jgi:hypothetical protein